METFGVFLQEMASISLDKESSKEQQYFREMTRQRKGTLSFYGQQHGGKTGKCL
jgi:hypothetical protein